MSVVLLCPAAALLNARAVGSIAVFGVAGIGCQQFTGHIGTLTAMHKALVLAAYRHGAFAVKGVSVGLYASAAAGGFLVFGLLIAAVNKFSKNKPHKKEFGCDNCPQAEACGKLKEEAAKK